MNTKQTQMGDDRTFKNIFKCECGNHESFTSVGAVPKNSTWQRDCDYCGRITDLALVKSEVQDQ